MRRLGLHTGILASLFLALAICLPVLGAEDGQVFDQAGLLSSGQIQQLESQAENLKETYRMNFVLVTTEDAQGKDSEEYADDFCMDYGFYDNEEKGTVTLLIDMDNRNVWVSTAKDMIYYLTDDRIEGVIDAGYEELRAGDYAACFANMLNQTAAYLEEGIPGDQYIYDTETGKIIRYRSIRPLEAGIAALIALAVAAGICIWVVGSYRMKWGTYQYPFREKGRMKLDAQSDRFMNQVVTTRRIPKNPPPSGGGGGSVSSTHTSRGGGSFGGGGRSF